MLYSRKRCSVPEKSGPPFTQKTSFIHENRSTFRSPGQRRIAVVNDQLRLLNGVGVYELSQTAVPLSEAVNQALGYEIESYERVGVEGRLLLPFDHPDPYPFWATGTGLTHLGSAI